jgi:hypothetical protein
MFPFTGGILPVELLHLAWHREYLRHQPGRYPPMSDGDWPTAEV